MVGRLNMFWNRKTKSGQTIDISIGKVELYNLTKRIIDTVERKAISSSKNFSVPIYLQEMEKELLCLSKNKLLDLPVKDANIIREALRAILVDANLLQEEKKFSKEDVEWFDKAEADQVKQYVAGGLPNGR